MKCFGFPFPEYFLNILGYYFNDKKLLFITSTIEAAERKSLRCFERNHLFHFVKYLGEVLTKEDYICKGLVEFPEAFDFREGIGIDGFFQCI